MGEIDRERVRRGGFRRFVRVCWSRVDNAPLVWSWHIDAVCEHLEAVHRREIRDLVINIPPGFSKSLISSVLWPAWVWTQDPGHRWITASYADSVSLRDARKCRTLIDSDWWAARWPEVAIPSDASASKAVGSYYTTAKGMRYSATVRGSVTGQHADTALVDDPIDPMGAELLSGVEIEAVITWWRGTMSTRFRDHTRSARVLVMQRLHEHDLTEEFIRAGSTVLCLPMRYESKHPHCWPRDPRTVEGELLCPARMPEVEVARLEKTLGPTRADGQLQQRPRRKTGEIFREQWFARRWTELPSGGTFALSVDCAFKGTSDSDWVVIQCWMQLGANHYLVDQVRGQWRFSETVLHLVAFCERWPQATLKLIEDKANGTAVMDVLKDKIEGIEAVEPRGGKQSRAQSCEPLWAAGNVLLPDSTHARYPDGTRGAAWVGEVDDGAPDSFIGEHLSFPRGSNDDQVDAASQYLSRNQNNYMALFEAAMKNL